MLQKQLLGIRLAQTSIVIPDSKVHGANMGPIWGRQDPGGPHVGPMNLAVWEHGACTLQAIVTWVQVTWLFLKQSLVTPIATIMMSQEGLSH